MDEDGLEVFGSKEIRHEILKKVRVRRCEVNRATTNLTPTNSYPVAELGQVRHNLHPKRLDVFSVCLHTIGSTRNMIWESSLSCTSTSSMTKASK
jgi:hypothetical protein